MALKYGIKTVILLLVVVAVFTAAMGLPVPIGDFWDFEGQGSYGKLAHPQHNVHTTSHPLHHVHTTSHPLHHVHDIDTTPYSKTKTLDTPGKKANVIWMQTKIWDYHFTIGTLTGVWFLFLIVAIAAGCYDKWDSKRIEELVSKSCQKY